MLNTLNKIEPVTLSDLKLHIDNMYSMLDPDKIDEWEIDGMDIYVGDEVYTLHIKKAA
jgi:hypothetical protein